MASVASASQATLSTIQCMKQKGVDFFFCFQGKKFGEQIKWHVGAGVKIEINNSYLKNKSLKQVEGVRTVLKNTFKFLLFYFFSMFCIHDVHFKCTTIRKIMNLFCWMLLNFVNMIFMFKGNPASYFLLPFVLHFFNTWRKWNASIIKPFIDKKTIHVADQMTTQALYDIFPFFSWLQGEELKRLFLWSFILMTWLTVLLLS